MELPPSAGTAPPAPMMAGRTNERMVDYMSINGKFTKVATTDNSVVVGLIGDLTIENIPHDDILRIASFYGANTEPDKFGYHFITADGAKSRGCKLPTNNYNGFIEIFV